MHIVFYGPEGSGKGTQAKFLSKKLNLPLITSGDLVRQVACEDKGLMGDVCRKALEEGKYVADSEMFVLWKWRLKVEDAMGGWIMDGFPRNIEQARFLDNKLDKYGYKIEKVIYLSLPEEASIKRLVKRARPLNHNSTQIHDTPERVRSRLEIYRKSETQVLNYYRKNGVLVTINGDQSAEAVHNEIMQKLEISKK